MKKLRDIGEFELIRRIEKLIPQDVVSPQVLMSIGDDCAVVEVGERKILVSSDMSVENVHFSSELFPPVAIGWKALASAWSDIASMGGKPLWAVVSWALLSDTYVGMAESIYRGMVEVTRQVGGAIVGGDTTGSESGIVIDATVVGEAWEGRYVTRSGARVGDVLGVTGTLGDSSAGLLALRERLPEPALWAEHWYPMPRVAEGLWLCQQGKLNAMIDISDGLIIDAGHIAERSNVGINIISEKIPYSEKLGRFCEKYKRNINQFVLAGGEDYQLLFTVAEEHWDQIASEFNTRFACKVTCIGYVTDEWAGVRVDGREIELQGYQHFL